MSDRRHHAVSLAAFIGLGLLLASLAAGCATVKADAKAVAEVCKPELLPDAIQALPLVASLALCEAQNQDCAQVVAELAAMGKADAQACAVAELHAAVVKVSSPDAGAP